MKSFIYIPIYVTGPGQMVPFWPLYINDQGPQILIRIKDTNKSTAPFSLKSEHSTLLMLGNRFGGIHVEVRCSASEILVTFAAYKRGTILGARNYFFELLLTYFFCRFGPSSINQPQ